MSEEGYVDHYKPVIGVLLQDLSVSLKKKYDENIYTSSLGASYAKFIKESGGRCLPIALCQKPDYYKFIVDIVDGILLPGGGFSLILSEGYTPSGKLLLDAVTTAADNGRIIPVFGICLGFELMAVYFAGNNGLLFDILTEIHPRNEGWRNLNWNDDAVSSHVVSEEALGRLQENNLSHFFHRQSVTEEKFDCMLGNDWRALATQEVARKEDGERVTIITVMESKLKPYFGVQFHPEKALYESGPRRKCDNIQSAELAAKDFNLILTKMVSQNVLHNFPQDELKRIIDRFVPEDVTMEDDIKYDFVYMFKDGDLVI